MFKFRDNEMVAVTFSSNQRYNTSFHYLKLLGLMMYDLFCPAAVRIHHRYSGCAVNQFTGQ